MEANAVDGTIVTLRQQKASGKTDACERGEGGSEGGGVGVVVLSAICYDS